MSARGFQYVPIDLATATAESAATLANRRVDYPFDPSVEGSTYAPLTVAPAPSVNNDVYARTLPPSESAAWADAALGDFDDAVHVQLPTGDVLDIPKKGCLTEGRVRVFGSLEDDAMFEAGIGNLRTTAIVRTLAEPSVADALNGWVSCMHDATGRDFDSFDQARNYAYAHQREAQVIAKADGICTASSSLRSTFVLRLNEIMAAILDENLGTLEDYDSRVKIAVETAKKLLTG
jgi:hypothetical protein